MKHFTFSVMMLGAMIASVSLADGPDLAGLGIGQTPAQRLELISNRRAELKSRIYTIDRDLKTAAQSATAQVDPADAAQDAAEERTRVRALSEMNYDDTCRYLAIKKTLGGAEGTDLRNRLSAYGEAERRLAKIAVGERRYLAAFATLESDMGMSASSNDAHALRTQGALVAQEMVWLDGLEEMIKQDRRRWATLHDQYERTALALEGTERASQVMELVAGVAKAHQQYASLSAYDKIAVAKFSAAVEALDQAGIRDSNVRRFYGLPQISQKPSASAR